MPDPTLESHYEIDVQQTPSNRWWAYVYIVTDKGNIEVARFASAYRHVAYDRAVEFLKDRPR